MNIPLNIPPYEANNTVHANNQKERINLSTEELGNFGICSERITYVLFQKIFIYFCIDCLYKDNGKGIKSIINNKDIQTIG